MALATNSKLRLATAQAAEVSDADLLTAAQVNPAVYGALYRRYAPRLITFFYYRVGRERETALDLAQDTFLRAYRHLPRYQERGYSYWAYLSTIANRVLANYYRQKKTLPWPEHLELASGEVDLYERQDLAAALWRAVKELPAIEQKTFILRYQDDLSLRQIATKIKKSENAVKLILFRARRHLAQHPYLLAFRQSGQ